MSNKKVVHHLRFSKNTAKKVAMGLLSASSVAYRVSSGFMEIKNGFEASDRRLRSQKHRAIRQLLK